jgi:hypothetical protein
MLATGRPFFVVGASPSHDRAALRPDVRWARPTPQGAARVRHNGTDDCPSTLLGRSPRVEVSMAGLRETGDPAVTTQMDKVGWMFALAVVVITAVAGTVAYYGVAAKPNIVASR